MIQKFKKYKRIEPLKVLAIKVTWKNHEEVYKYIKDYFSVCKLLNGLMSNDMIMFIQNGTSYVVSNGDYIYRDEEGYFRVCPKTYFATEFKEIKGNK